MGPLKAQIKRAEEAGRPVPPDLLQKKTDLEKQISDYNQKKATTKTNQSTSKAMNKGKSADSDGGSGLRDLTTGKVKAEQEDDWLELLEGKVLREGDDAESSVDIPLSTLKRKTSETSIATPDSASKKKRHADSDLFLDFEPEPELPDYVPQSLTIPKLSSDMVKLPIFLARQGKTIVVDCEYYAGAESKDFWEEVAERVKAMEGTGFASYPPIQEHDIRQLDFAGSIIPKLLGLDGRLQYHMDTKYDRINKSQYKNYLKNVSVNLANLLKVEKDTVRDSSTANPLTKTKVASLLQNAEAGRTMVTVNELSNILQAQITFQNSTIDIVRKQLAGLGAVLSNLAESTKRERKQTDAVAKWIVKFLEEKKPIASSNPSDLSFGEASASKPVVPIIDPFNQKTPSNQKTLTHLPRVLMNTVLDDQIHQCRCIDCNPEFIKEQEQRVTKELTDEFTNTTRHELLEVTVQSLRDSVDQEAVRIMRQEILEEEIANMKEQLRKEMEPKLREEIQKEETVKLRANYKKLLEL